MNLRSSSIESLVPLIQGRFSSFTESEVIVATTWADPEPWEEDRSKNGITAITKIMDKFTEPLNAAGFDRSKVFTEWKSLQSTVKSYYTPILPALPMFGQNYSFTESMSFQIY